MICSCQSVSPRNSLIIDVLRAAGTRSNRYAMTIGKAPDADCGAIGLGSR